jgi:hypothetical protein
MRWSQANVAQRKKARNGLVRLPKQVEMIGCEEPGTSTSRQPSGSRQLQAGWRLVGDRIEYGRSWKMPIKANMLSRRYVTVTNRHARDIWFSSSKSRLVRRSLPYQTICFSNRLQHGVSCANERARSPSLPAWRLVETKH